MGVELVPCESCERPVNDRFAKCPFCGAARRASVEVRPSSLDGAAAGQVSKDLPPEARVAIARSFMGQPKVEVTGSSSALMSALLPSPHSTGVLRTIEIGLTIVTIPFFLASLTGIVITGVKKWGRVDVLSWISGASLGAGILSLILHSMGVPDAAVFWTVAIGFGAWTLRGLLRFFVAVKRMGDNA